MKNMEKVFILGILLFSIVAILEGNRLPRMSQYTIGPGFLPLVVGILMFIIAAIIFAQNILQHKGNTEGKAFIKKEGVFRLSFFVVVLLISLLLNRVLGLVIPITLFMVVIFRYIEKYSWFTSIRVAILCNILLYLVFQTWLGVPLPGVNL